MKNNTLKKNNSVKKAKTKKRKYRKDYNSFSDPFTNFFNSTRGGNRY